jgi:hypothetical protein
METAMTLDELNAHWVVYHLKSQQERFGQYVMNRQSDIPWPNPAIFYEQDKTAAFNLLAELTEC